MTSLLGRTWLMRLTTWPTGIPVTSRLAALVMRRGAYEERGYCSGTGKGPGDSGASQAWVQAVRSRRAGLPVRARDRTASDEVAWSSLSITMSLMLDSV